MIELHVKNDLTEPKVVTPDHLVWAKVDAGSEWRWTKACDLQEGSFLLDGGDETTVVRKVVPRSTAERGTTPECDSK